ncbi:hypothetical protein [Rhizosaccharibacter radicis]|uniref:Pectate lyase superfamily protein domain-containing protein n=1 Tax=Rhizosaccharibacter radicis TaxID=2782605 RepID=A0ABT1VUJ1_9PROT|nr:hypothetical protein [Acetobacteraceae bacterium KSS12]
MLHERGWVEHLPRLVAMVAMVAMAADGGMKRFGRFWPVILAGLLPAAAARADGPSFTRAGGISAPGANPSYSIDAATGMARFRALDPSTTVTGTSLAAMLAQLAAAQATAAAAVRAAGGDSGATVVTATGTATPRTAADRAADRLSALDFGAPVDGSADAAAAINAGTARMGAGGTVLLPPGTLLLTSTLLLRSGVRMLGSGAGTILRCGISPCVSQAPGSQLSGTALTDVRFVPATGGDAGDVLMALPTVSHSEIGRILVEGFTGATVLSTGGALATSTPDASLGSNVTWNNVHDLTVYGCGTCLVIQGHLNASLVPDQVNTQNIYSNINLFAVQTKGIDITVAADTNAFFGGLINLAGAGSTGVMQGDDGRVTGAANTYVNSNKFFGLAFSHQPAATSFTLFGGSGLSFATEGYGVETDIDTTQPGAVAIDMPNAASYRICGKRLDQLSNLYLGCQETGIGWRQTVVPGAATAGNTYSTPAGVQTVVLSGGGNVSGFGIALPANPPDGQVENYTTTSQTITNLSWGSVDPAAGVYGGPATLSPTAPVSFKYIKGSRSWVHVGGGG